MEVKDAIKKRRSIRKYLDKPVSPEIIDELIEAARISPSAYNSQPWKFKIITDPKTIDKLKEKEIFKNTFVYSAPLIIVCCGDESCYPEKAKDYSNTKELVIGDVYIAAQTMVLRATELGLGTCYIGLLDREKIKEVLGIPKEFIIPFAIPVGYPDGEPGLFSRKNKDEILLK